MYDLLVFFNEHRSDAFGFSAFTGLFQIILNLEAKCHVPSWHRFIQNSIIEGFFLYNFEVDL